MPQDSFTLKYVSRELNERFAGGKISRINQPSKDLLSLLIYTREGTVKLDIDLSAKFCRISAGERTEFPNPKAAPNFCMLLRKHLQNAEITQIGQVDAERVVYFRLKCFSEFEISEMTLYLEIMGKYSNAVLVKDGKILGALKTASLETGARRVTLSGAVYRLPEKQDKVHPADLKGLEGLLPASSPDPAKVIADGVAGVAYTTALDAVELYGDGITAKQLYGYLNAEEYQPCLVMRDGEPADFKARLSGGEPRASLLQAQAEFYDYAVRKKLFGDGRRRLISALASAEKKVEKRLAQTYDKLKECETAELIKLKGELITANIYAVQRGARTLEAVNYYDENGGTVTVELDPRLTPSQNAQKYFKRYQKLKRTTQTLNAQRAESEERRDYLKSINANLSLAENADDLKETEEELIALGLLPAPREKGGKKPKQQERVPFRRYSFDGFTVLCGRNNLQNDRLTKGLAPTDLWLHAKNYHSAHVGIITYGRQPTDGVIKFSAEVCAHYSDARENGKVPVDYTLKKYVKKPNGARSGFVVYTDFKTILVTPDAHTEEREDER